jgi:hypothetical protein
MSSKPENKSDASVPVEGTPTQATADSAGDEEGVDKTELSLDYVFEILKNERRRRVLSYLRTHDERVTLSDLAEHIAALENDTDVASITSSQRKRVYVGLYQCHLPKMDDMGVVDFNQNRGIVELGPHAAQLYEYLDNESEATRNWPMYYLGIATVGILHLGIALSGLVQSALFVVAGFGLVCLAMGGCAISHLLSMQDDDTDWARPDLGLSIPAES